MKYKVNLATFAHFLVLMTVTVAFSCADPEQKLVFPQTNLTEAHLIPMPLEVTATGGGFALDSFTGIYADPDGQGFADVSAFLSDHILEETGLDIRKPEKKAKTAIYIQKSKRSLGHAEAYHIRITRDSIVLLAHTSEAAFRGAQTIRQLIPSVPNDTLAAYNVWVLPTGTIKDQPRFNFRSTMLDVARHFFSVDDVKKYIELLSYYKINYLHLHLSDDQGWRIEIKSWPKLANVGGMTAVGGGPGGYYTQEDYAEIVRFAAAHYITVIPEIDMPGHTNAAAVAYPFLNGNGKTPEVYTKMRVGFSTLDTRKDSVYEFIDDVVREIAALTPGPYFHIGGDESHATEKHAYTYFVNRAEQIVQKYGKRMIGWDEVATADVDSSSVAQFWLSDKNLNVAILKGMRVILSPSSKAYLDMKYNADSQFGLKWAGYIPVDSAYDWDPEIYTSKDHILGIEAPLWSETIADVSGLEYLAFPRVIGFAEMGWSAQEHRSWEGFRLRLASHAAFLNSRDVNYYRSPLIDWKE